MADPNPLDKPSDETTDKTEPTDEIKKPSKRSRITLAEAVGAASGRGFAALGEAYEVLSGELGAAAHALAFAGTTGRASPHATRTVGRFVGENLEALVEEFRDWARDAKHPIDEWHHQAGEFLTDKFPTPAPVQK